MNLDSTIDSDRSSSSSGRRSRLMASGRVLEGSKIDRFGELPSGTGLELLSRLIVGTPDTDGPSTCLVLWGPSSRS
jgi:hypothetical protein